MKKKLSNSELKEIIGGAMVRQESIRMADAPVKPHDPWTLLSVRTYVLINGGSSNVGDFAKLLNAK